MAPNARLLSQQYIPQSHVGSLLNTITPTSFLTHVTSPSMTTRTTTAAVASTASSSSSSSTSSSLSSAPQLNNFQVLLREKHFQLTHFINQTPDILTAATAYLQRALLYYHVDYFVDCIADCSRVMNAMSVGSNHSTPRQHVHASSPLQQDHLESHEHAPPLAKLLRRTLSDTQHGALPQLIAVPTIEAMGCFGHACLLAAQAHEHLLEWDDAIRSYHLGILWCTQAQPDLFASNSTPKLSISNLPSPSPDSADHPTKAALSSTIATANQTQRQCGEESSTTSTPPQQDPTETLRSISTIIESVPTIAQSLLHGLFDLHSFLNDILKTTQFHSMTPSAAQDTDLMQALTLFDSFTQWLLQHGARFPKLAIKHFSPTYRGVFSTTNVKCNEILLHLPIPLIITSQVAQNSDIGRLLQDTRLQIRSRHTFLAFFLLQEKYRSNWYDLYVAPTSTDTSSSSSLSSSEPHHQYPSSTTTTTTSTSKPSILPKSPSFFRPYLDILPIEFDTVPLFFNQEYFSLLQGSFVLDKIDDRLLSLYEEYSNVKHAIYAYAKQYIYFKQRGLIHLQHQQQLPCVLDQSISSQYPHHNPQVYTTAGAQVVDLIDNHRSTSGSDPTLASSVATHTNDNLPKYADFAHLPTASQSSLPFCSLLDNLPLQDAEFDKAIWRDVFPYSYQDFLWARICVITRIFGLHVQDIKTDGLVPLADMLNHKLPRETRWEYDTPSKGFIITSLQPQPHRGVEIFDSYGRKCNNRFFINYGFALLDNIDNEATVQCGLNFAAVASRFVKVDSVGLLQAVDNVDSRQSIEEINPDQQQLPPLKSSSLQDQPSQTNASDVKYNAQNIEYHRNISIASSASSTSAESSAKQPNILLAQIPAFKIMHRTASEFPHLSLSAEEFSELPNISLTLHRKAAWLGVSDALNYGDQLLSIMLQIVFRRYQIPGDINSPKMNSMLSFLRFLCASHDDLDIAQRIIAQQQAAANDKSDWSLQTLTGFFQGGNAAAPNSRVDHSSAQFEPTSVVISPECIDELPMLSVENEKRVLHCILYAVAHAQSTFPTTLEDDNILLAAHFHGQAVREHQQQQLQLQTHDREFGVEMSSTLQQILQQQNQHSQSLDIDDHHNDIDLNQSILENIPCHALTDPAFIRGLFHPFDSQSSTSSHQSSQNNPCICLDINQYHCVVQRRGEKIVLQQLQNFALLLLSYIEQVTTILQNYSNESQHTDSDLIDAHRQAFGKQFVFDPAIHTDPHHFRAILTSSQRSVMDEKSLLTIEQLYGPYLDQLHEVL